VGLTIVLIIAISLLVSPNVRVMAENLFSFWKKVDNQQVITPFPEVPAIDPEEIPAIVESLQEEIKSTQQATVVNAEEEYIIKIPTLLPVGHRIGVVERGHRGNAILDLSGGHYGVRMTVTIRPANEMQGKILGPEDKVEKVTISDITYEYVRGGWGIGNSFSSLMDSDTVKDLSWIDDYDGIHKLSWFDGNMNYYMLVAGSSSPGTDLYLGMNDLVKIASSFKPLENGSRPPLDFFEPDHGIDEKPFEYIKDISVLEDLVRFNIPEASVLPGNFSFKNGMPVFTGNHVIMYYSCTDDTVSSEEMNEFEFEFSIGRYTKSGLAKEFEMFGGYEVGEDAFIETILINDVEVQYVRGGWTSKAGERTWDNNLKQFKMVWYQDGLLYNLHNPYTFHDDQGSCAITKANLVEFVESVQKDLKENVYQPPIKPSSRDDTTENQSITAVNTEEEYIIKIPTLLPVGHSIGVVKRGVFGNAFLDLSRGSYGVLVTVSIRPAVEVEGTILGPEEKVEKVTIGDITYEYVRGGWGIGNALSTQMDPEAVKDLSWIDDYDGIHKLRWFDGNMNYYMSVAGSSLPGSDWYLGMNDLVIIASSFKPLENGARPPLEFFKPDYGIDEKPFEYINDISFLEDLVRFNIPEATVLPGNFSFKNGMPVFTGNHVIMYYSCTDDTVSSEEMNEFEFEFSIGRYTKSGLAKEFEMFGGYEVGEDAFIETILINDVEVQYVRGGWTSKAGERTWDNNLKQFKVVWYKDGLLYNLRNPNNFHDDQGSCALTKEELIKFVKGLQ
jgi:hypothetical protein